MKKKSHLSLAGYILQNIECKELNQHRRSFLIGSVLPDYLPSFITRRHTMEETFAILKKEMKKALEGSLAGQGISAAYCRRLGVITHYIADFFTFPHNAVFQGKILEHCAYEDELEKTFVEYMDSMPMAMVRRRNGRFQSVDQICDFISEMHKSYMKAVTGVKADARYIVELCFRVVDALLQVIEMKASINQIDIES